MVSFFYVLLMVPYPTCKIKCKKLMNILLTYIFQKYIYHQNIKQHNCLIFFNIDDNNKKCFLITKLPY